jgi:hypothetical protein
MLFVLFVFLFVSFVFDYPKEVPQYFFIFEALYFFFYRKNEFYKNETLKKKVKLTISLSF